MSISVCLTCGKLDFTDRTGLCVSCSIEFQQRTEACAQAGIDLLIRLAAQDEMRTPLQRGKAA